MLTYARHSWPLSSEGSLTRHIHCDTGLPFIMVISQDTWHSHLLLSVWQWSCHYLFLRLRSVATGDRTPIPNARRTLYLYATPAVLRVFIFFRKRLLYDWSNYNLCNNIMYFFWQNWDLFVAIAYAISTANSIPYLYTLPSKEMCD